MEYKRLTQEERYYIYMERKSNKSISEIAEKLHRDKSAISRELQRNTGLKGYRYKQAHVMTLERRQASHKPRIVDDVWKSVLLRLQEDHSPEQISNSLKKQGIKISHERIYQFLHKDKKEGGVWYKHLRCQRKKKRRYAKPDNRGAIKGRVNISERPSIVDERGRYGDWEADTVETYKGGAVFVTLLERKSRLYLALRVANKKAKSVKDGIITLLSNIKDAVHTITFDNGKEFAYYKEIAKELDCDTYFANPYHSWERGANENSNGLLRQYYPKGKDISSVTDEEIGQTVLKINNRPRKCINYETPFNVFVQHLKNVALAS